MTLLLQFQLQLRTKPNPKTTLTTNPTFLLSTSSPFSSSYFSDLKHTLKHQQQQQQQQPPSRSKPSTLSLTNSQQQPSLDEIRRNLSAFRRRTTAGDDASPPHQKPISFQELYERSVLHKPPEPDGDSGSGHGAKPAGGSGGRFSIDSIRESLKKIGGDASDRRGVDWISLREYKDALRMRPSADSTSSSAVSSPESLQEYKDAFRLRPSSDTSSSPAVSSSEKVIGGTSVLPESVFGREMRDKRERDESAPAAMPVARSEFLRVYNYADLGEKLRKLRPEVKGKGKEWFSIGELNERLMRLREIEEKETESNIKGLVSFKDLREHLVLLNETNDKNSRKSSLQKFNILSQLGGTPAYVLDPPKEHLVEMYFHPDNMSSAEKLKIELAKVREQFKMSESDCGSARVQVAQLTTKIKHLSAVLHKKDVHSRKGLLAMVQRRKRLLKYLRRTDWDSYCFVISKLGLRDNPDHGHKTQKTGRPSQATSS